MTFEVEVWHKYWQKDTPTGVQPVVAADIATAIGEIMDLDQIDVIAMTSQARTAEFGQRTAFIIQATRMNQSLNQDRIDAYMVAHGTKLP